MKKIFILTALFLMLISIQVYAHPGRTDESGGHHDYDNVSELGSYHYHCGGNPPHLHENGVCPYSYNESPEKNNHSSSSSNSGNYDSNTNNESTLDLFNEPSEKTNESKDIDWVIIISGSIVGIPSLFFIICLIISTVSFFKRKKANAESLKEANDYEYYFSCYGFYSPENFVEIPKGTYIKDGLPCSDGPGHYGIYTVYITPKGTKFHRRNLCIHSPNIEETNIVHIIGAYYPCRRCVKNVPDLKWYWEYKRILDIKKKYNIP